MKTNHDSNVDNERVFHLGSMRVIQRGRPFRFRWSSTDFYHLLFTLSWGYLILGLSVGYVVLNFVFAIIYLLGGGDCIANTRPGSFADAFFFSVQTMATIGYGAMYPETPYCNFWVVVEVFIGLVGMAMATGLMFARFSRPSARVLFSQVAVICPFNGVPTLMLRAANQRSNLIIEAQVTVSLLLPEITPEGHRLRRLHDLELTRSQTPMFSLSWMMMHPITAASPLAKLTATDLYEQDARLIVTLTGLDETVSQVIHARQQYDPTQILWNMRFVDVLEVLPGGDRVINYADFHKAIPWEEAANSTMN